MVISIPLIPQSRGATAGSWPGCGERGNHHRPGTPDGGLDDGFALPRQAGRHETRVDSGSTRIHRVAHDHAGEPDQAEHVYEAERLVGDVELERGNRSTILSGAVRNTRVRRREARRTGSSRSVGHHCITITGQHDEDRGIALGGFLERAAIGSIR